MFTSCLLFCCIMLNKEKGDTMIDTTSMGIMASMMQPTTSVMATQMVTKKDSDSDFSLTLEEMGISEETFTSFDTNSDGLVGKSELTTAIDTALSEFNGQMPSKEEFQSILSDFGFDAPTGSSEAIEASGSTSSQANTIASILENYDADNLSQSDALEIVAAFKEAGIEPGSELESAMEDAGFDAKEVGTLADAGPEGSGHGGGPGGGGGGGESASSEEEDYDIMDTNEDGIVSAQEEAEYYGTSDSDTQELSSNNQNALDNLQLLMETLKSSSKDGSIDSTSFDGLLKTINNQNNNSSINNYLTNYRTTSTFAYA